MKKLFFTAIALVAFSGISIAKKSNVSIVLPDACADWASSMASADEDEFGCMSSSEYNASYYSYLRKCRNH
jgi:hypothetical protein